MKEKTNQNRCIRFPESLHREIKFRAFKEGKTIQDWVFEALQKKIEEAKEKPRFICQKCGNWQLHGTPMVKIGTCENCGKENEAVIWCKE